MEFQEFVEELGKDITKESAIQFIKTFGDHPALGREDLRKIRSRQKKKVIEVVATVFSDRKNFESFLSILTYREQEIFKEVFISISLPVGEVLLDRELRNKKFLEKILILTFHREAYGRFSFWRSNSFARENLVLSIPPSLRKWLVEKEIIDIPGLNLTSVDEDEVKVSHFKRFDKNFPITFKKLVEIIRSGSGEFKKDGSIKIPYARKICSSMNMEEFFPKGKSTKGILRTKLILEFAALFRDTSFESSDSLEFFSEAVKEKLIEPGTRIYDDFIELFEFLNRNLLKNFISGRPYHCRDFIRCVGDLTKEILYRFPEGWIDVDSIINYVIIRGMVEGCYRCAENEWRYMYSYDSYLNVRKNHRKYLIEPLVKQLFFLLASLELLEIAYDDSSTSINRYYDGVKFIRLTPLALFISGRVKDYKIEEEEKGNYYLDQRELLIKTEGDVSQYIPIIEKVCTRVGKNLFAVDMKKLLKLKKPFEALDMIIKLSANEKIPFLWSDLFRKQALKKNIAIDVTGKYRILEINSPEIAERIFRDPRIFLLSDRAEGRKLVVPEEKVSELLKILSEYEEK